MALPAADLATLMAARVQQNHDDFVERNRAIFLEWPPGDFAPYAYTYYDALGEPVYHGYTTDARKRAKDHFKLSPWAGWVDDVRYRRCSTAKAARRLETRLKKGVPAYFNWTYQGYQWWWSDVEGETKANHVTGSCKLPGGVCDVEALFAELAIPRVLSPRHNPCYCLPGGRCDVKRLASELAVRWANYSRWPILRP